MYWILLTKVGGRVRRAKSQATNLTHCLLGKSIFDKCQILMHPEVAWLVLWRSPQHGQIPWDMIMQCSRWSSVWKATLLYLNVISILYQRQRMVIRDSPKWLFILSGHHWEFALGFSGNNCCRFTYDFSGYHSVWTACHNALIRLLTTVDLHGFPKTESHKLQSKSATVE